MHTQPPAPPLSQDELKALVGRAALAHVVPGQVLGVGTGSTVNHFIDALASMRDAIPGAVSSSEASTQRLQAVGIRVLDAQAVEGLSVYIDGADEIDGHGFMVKGGGAALTREKIVAAMAQRFVCIADESKRVQTLGAFPLPVEVIQMAAAKRVCACAMGRLWSPTTANTFWMCAACRSPTPWPFRTRSASGRAW